MFGKNALSGFDTVKMKRRRILSVAGLVAALLAAFLCGLLFGSVSLDISRLIGAIDKSDRTAAIILWQLRLPRVLAAALAGCGLSVAGTLLQAVTDNDLCAPHIIGVNAGAGFAVMCLLCAFPLAWRLQPLMAFIGAFGATALVLAISCAGRGHHRKTTIILAGVALSALLNAGISALSIQYPDVLSSYAAFSVGGFSGISLTQLQIPAVMIFVCLLASCLIAPKVALFCLGDDGARSMGVSVGRIRFICILLASALCAAVVSFAGLLGFVGLVVPHITKRLFGGSLRNRLICGAGAGAVLVILSDLAGRVVASPGELPAGIFMALLGGPFFIYLLIRGRRNDSV